MRRNSIQFRQSIIEIKSHINEFIKQFTNSEKNPHFKYVLSEN